MTGAGGLAFGDVLGLVWPLPPFLPTFRGSLRLDLIPLCLPGAVEHRAGAQEIFVSSSWNSTRGFCTPSLGHTQ